jgi:tetratricopeptide (TPR) repeat protein
MNDIQQALGQAVQYLNSGQPGNAEKLFRQILAVEPDQPVALHLLGVLAHRAGQSDDGLRLINRALALQPDYLAAHNNLGNILRDLDRLEDAERSYRRAIELQEDYAQAHANLGLVLFNQGQTEAAIASLRQALALEPEYPDALNNLGNALQQTGELAEAADYFEQATRLAPQDARSHCNLGTARRMLGEMDAAIASFRQALALQPDFSEAHNKLGTALQKQGDSRQAIDHYRQAIEQRPDFAEAHSNLGNALELQGELEAAENSYRRALELDPELDEAKAALGAIMLARGQDAGALQLQRQAHGSIRFDPEQGCSLALPAELESPAISRIEIPGSDEGAPHFIGCWKIEPDTLCRELIDLFNRQQIAHSKGKTAGGLNPDAKLSTDLSVRPKDLDREEFKVLRQYFQALYLCHRNYLQQWPFLETVLSRTEIGSFNLQHYAAGGHFKKPHSERTTLGSSHRVLAWMTYLNDVDDGGNTHFIHQNLDIKPEQGKTLIWPAEWTHAHLGQVVNSGEKYIITGWMHFPGD